MANVSQAMKAKSDQLNYVDIGESEIIIKIEAVKVINAPQQPVSIYYEGCNNRPYKPSKGMIRVIAGAWGEESDCWLGKSLKLYGDKTVTFGGGEVGGIRIHSMSDIAKEGYTAFIQKNKQVRVKQTIPLLVIEPPKPAEPTENDLGWVKAGKADIKTLDQLTDPNYRKYIESLINAA